MAPTKASAKRKRGSARAASGTSNGAVKGPTKGTPWVYKPRGRPEARVYLGDCREVLPTIPEVAKGQVDLVFADPPFNWARDYDRFGVGNKRGNEVWDDKRGAEEYLAFTYAWLDLCVGALKDSGSMWVNIPDTWAAEIVVHLKKSMTMVNWCVWHYRFGQNTRGKFINSKVHVLYFCKDPSNKTWNPDPVLEVSDRRSIYFDARTEDKRDGMPAGLRVPMDVWYGRFWGRVQGNNKERREKHDNQLPEVYLDRVISCSSNPDDLVLDPFLGSGTTGVVAHALGRRFIGCEYSKVNAQHACERIVAGPIRDLEAMRHDSTAIHGPRRKSARSPESADAEG